METTLTTASTNAKPGPNTGWNDSDMLFLLSCYDVWSATPPRGCLCGDPVPTPETDD